MTGNRTNASPDEKVLWHLLKIEEAARRLDADVERGLETTEAQARLERFGRNEIQEGRRRGPARMLFDQFTDFMILILIAAAVISGVVGELIDTVVILIIVALNAVIGFVQEYRAERAVAALKALAALSAHVVRDGESAIMPATELVPGDVVLLDAGSAVPADLRLIETAQLKTEEAALSGESQPVEKHTHVLHEADLPLGDRRNMAYKGTLVTYGRGRGVVVATGMETELGRIARLLREAEETKTPLQKRLARFGRILVLAVLAICTIMFVAGILRGEPLILMLLTAISLAVAAIPEALPAVVTVSLALGARKMVAKNALIRKLPAVETLGSVTYICSDKTGTLTENKMRVEEVFSDARLIKDMAAVDAHAEPWSTLFYALALSNDAKSDAGGNVIGDPTEVALYRAAEVAGFVKNALASERPRIGELPFDSERARMTTLHREPSGVIAFTKGASERLLPLCHDMLGPAGSPPLFGASRSCPRRLTKKRSRRSLPSSGLSA
jgi:P-type Ca2+ transporter type 2C